MFQYCLNCVIIYGDRHRHFLYFRYTICVAGVACDIFSKDNFLRVGMTNRQHLPIIVITIQEKKKSYFSEHSITSQAPPRRHRHLQLFFLRIQPYLEFIDICIQANRLTLYQCTKINRFICKISAFRTENDRSFSVSSTSG